MNHIIFKRLSGQKAAEMSAEVNRCWSAVVRFLLLFIKLSCMTCACVALTQNKTCLLVDKSQHLALLFA